MRRSLLLIGLALGVFGGAGRLALAAGHKPPTPPGPSAAPPMKRAITLDAIQDHYIELPDPTEPVLTYGGNIYATLIDDLVKTGDYAVLVGDGPQLSSSALRAAERVQSGPGPDPCLINTVPPDSSSHIKINVNELSFSVGGRGERMFYGFKQGFENAYNAGVTENNRNEFPLRTIEADPTWFENTFADTGHLHDGLSLGSEFDFDLLFVGAKLKHYSYQGTIGLDVEFDNRFGAPVRKQLSTHGQGFYFDLSANLVYNGIDYMAGMMIARKTALLDAFNRAVGAAVKAIGAEIRGLPLMTRLAAACGDVYYVSTGANYNVPVGQRFYDLTQLNAGKSPTVFTVTQVFQMSASVAISGQGFAIGDELVTLQPGEPVPQPKALVVSREELVGAGIQDSANMPPDAAAGPAGPALPASTSIDAGTVNIDVPSALAQFVEGFFQRLLAGIEALVLLPYNAYRWFAYDQTFGGGEIAQVDPARAVQLAQGNWALKSIGMPAVYQSCVGSKDANCLGSRGLIVAVIDSGVDYNHKELRRNIFWDGVADTPGLDLISGDPRPYDDHEHGTTVASVITGGGSRIVGVAPNVTVMALKAFSPYGITTSAALYASFEYAVAQGAKIIVTGWGTQKKSRALEDGVKLAAANGVLIVAAAGDGGRDLSQTPYYPASYLPEVPNMIVVAGENQEGGLTQASGMYSNYGAGVELAAPGAAVLVATPRNGYASRSSTGIAAGFVAGAAALAWSTCPKSSAATVKAAILEGANVDNALRGDVAGNRSLFVPGILQKAAQYCK